MKLDEMQQWVQSALVHPGGTGQRERAEELIVGNARLKPAQRLAIYQRGYYSRLLECMSSQFKALKHALGAELFHDFARLYLEAHPSRSHSLAELGAGFADHLEATRPDRESGEREAWIDFMIDLARFEWDLASVFDRAGHEGRPYAPEATPDESLILQSCFALHRYRYPVGGYYRLVAQGQNPAIPPAIETHLALLRKDYRVCVHQLTAEQFAFLGAMQGRPAADTLAPAVVSEWREWRTAWMEAGFFVAKSPR